jgi:hypothetical protein
VPATTFQRNSQAKLNTPAPPQQATNCSPPRRVPIPTPLPTLSIVSDDEDSDDKHEPPPRVPTHHAVPLVPGPQLTTTPPALNTCSQVRSLTYDAMLHICPHITIASRPHKLHNDIIQLTCSMQYSMTRLVS